MNQKSMVPNTGEKNENMESSREEIFGAFFRTKNGAITKKLCPPEDRIHQCTSSTKIGTKLEINPKITYSIGFIFELAF